MPSYMLPEYHSRSSLTWDMGLCHTHQILLFSHPLTTIFFQAFGHFFTPKIFCSKGRVESAFKDFLASEPSEFYHEGINNLVNWWQKCIDVQRSYFNWLNTLFKFIHLGIKDYSKIRLFFPEQPNKTESSNCQWIWVSMSAPYFWHCARLNKAESISRVN